MNEKFLEQFKEKTKEEISTLNYKKYFYQYSDNDRNNLTRELKEIEKFFKEELEIDVYPVYGTLLGMMREHDFIDWDTDIDLAYLSKCKTQKAVMNEFNLICKFLEEKTLLLYRIKTASHLHVFSPSKALRIDLWISWIDENNKYHIVWTVAGDIDASVILPFKQISFRNQSFNLVNNSTQWLNEHYINWQNPIDGSEKQWARRLPVFELEKWHGK